MIELQEVSGCPVVGWGAGMKEGSMKLDENLKLENVLYVPCLTCNLISMSQLIYELNCIVQFTNNLCYSRPHLEDADWCG